MAKNTIESIQKIKDAISENKKSITEYTTRLEMALDEIEKLTGTRDLDKADAELSKLNILHDRMERKIKEDIINLEDLYNQGMNGVSDGN